MTQNQNTHVENPTQIIEGGKYRLKFTKNQFHTKNTEYLLISTHSLKMQKVEGGVTSIWINSTDSNQKIMNEHFELIGMPV